MKMITNEMKSCTNNKKIQRLRNAWEVITTKTTTTISNKVSEWRNEWMAKEFHKIKTNITSSVICYNFNKTITPNPPLSSSKHAIPQWLKQTKTQ